MGLAVRLRQIELKLKPVNIVPQRPFDIDQCIVHMGLDPAVIRESARRTGSSLAVAISVKLGIEPMEFARLIKEKANLVRW